MSPELSLFIQNYGYVAIFALIFLQEIGIPNPVPNELVLIYAGFLCSNSTLNLPLVVLSAITADFIGTNILYFAFLNFGAYILKNKPTWLPISEKAIQNASNRVSNGGLWAIFLGRITPFIRGYTSVVAGILHIKPKKFLPVAILSALVWSMACVLIGRLSGEYWPKTTAKYVNHVTFFNNYVTRDNKNTSIFVGEIPTPSTNKKSYENQRLFRNRNIQYPW